MRMEYDLIDCCPVPHRLASVVEKCLKDSGATLNSAYRGEDAAGLLAQCGKHSQKYLYDHQNEPGFNPANPPGHSTHELHNDGVAYDAPDGAALKWWQCGLDVDDAHVRAFIDAAKAQGWIASITYPGSASEYHHLNFRKMPILFISIGRGSKGKRVLKLSKRLRYIRQPDGQEYFKGGEAVSEFGPKLEQAVKGFQKDHHLKADGIVGAHTQAQIDVTFRRQYKTRK